MNVISIDDQRLFERVQEYLSVGASFEIRTGQEFGLKSELSRTLAALKNDTRIRTRDIFRFSKLLGCLGLVVGEQEYAWSYSEIDGVVVIRCDHAAK